MNPAPLHERHRRLIETVARAWRLTGQWPLFPHVEAALDHEHGLQFDEVIADVPPGLVWSPAGYGPMAEIRASVAALAAIGAASEDLDRYVALVRRAAAIERDYIPGPLDQPDLRLGPIDVAYAGELATDDPQARQRLKSLVEAEFVLAFSGALDGEWWLSVDSRVRPYRDVVDVDDYVARRPTPTVPGSRVFAPARSGPRIFVVMPFGLDWSRNVYDMIGQACEEVAATVEGLTWQRADEIAEPGRITDQIVNAIETADLIVADLSGNNPNVMFELGYADRAEKEVVLLNQEIDATPFDIKDWRQIRYDVHDLRAGRAGLVTFIRGALSRRGYS